MKEVFESLLGIFFVIAVLLTSTSIISVALDARNTDTKLQIYTTEMEHSNFNNKVLAGVFEDAHDADYQNIQMELYERDDYGTLSQRTVTNAADINNTNRVYMAKLTMDYVYNLDFLQLRDADKNSELFHRTVSVYAR